MFSKFKLQNIFCILIILSYTFTNYSKASLNNLDLENTVSNFKDIDNRNRSYIVGAGDELTIRFNGVSEFNGDYFVGPDGVITLPELRGVYVQDLTLEEIYQLLNKKYSEVLISPNILITIKKYRPVQIFIKGEVRRPGLYTLLSSTNGSKINLLDSQIEYEKISTSADIIDILPQEVESFSKTNFPSIYSAIKASNGITPYSDLSKVRVIRKDTFTNGGGSIYTDINFLSFITEGDFDSNIRLFDGDIIEIPRSKKLLTEQLIEATNSNLNPANLVVYVGGNVQRPGETIVPQGSSLNHAIASSGGRKDLSGNIEFYRLSKDGDLKRREFSYSKTSKIGTYKNPVLVNGDIIKVNNSNFKRFTNVFGEITAPFLGVYSVLKLFED